MSGAETSPQEKAASGSEDPSGAEHGGPTEPELAGGPVQRLLRRIGLTLDMIKFQHTIFGLPFAFLGAVLAAGGWPSRPQIFWILMACVFARSAAMSFNRLHDEPFDRQNPRTKTWALPAGLLSRRFVWAFCILCIVGFVFSAAMLNRLALLLSPIALAVLLGYSLTKRVTAGAHFFLGMALGIAPIGAWVAVRAELDWPPVVLGLAVMLWTAGFDMIYSLQDIEIDRKLGLNSLPSRLGPKRALAISALSHAVAITAFGLLVPFTALGIFYLSALAVCAWLLVVEQRLVSADDLSRLPMAFFTLNGWVSILMFAGGLTDILMKN